MKEISKYLIEFIQKDFLSKNTNHWKTQMPKSSSSTNQFLLNFYEKCEDAENLWKGEKSRIRSSPMDFSTEYDRGEHYHLIPLKIREIIENRQKVGISYEFSVYEHPIRVFVIYPYDNDDPVERVSAEKQRKYFEECIHRIYLWLSIVYPLKRRQCSQQLSIYLYLTDQTKELEELSTKQELGQDCVNTAFTFPCIENNEIHLYREEEWLKVFIHETFHSLGLDFAYSESLSNRSDTQIRELFSPMPKTTDIRTSEIYCEMNAEIWNLVLYSFFTKKNTESFLKRVRELLWYEKVFSVFQCVKVLRTKGLCYEDLYSNETVSITKRKNYKETTPVFSYYVLKSICMTYNTEFIEWLEKQNGGSISFSATEENVDRFVGFIREYYTDSVYLENIRIIEKWFSLYHSKDVLENETLKMNLVEF
jgi:hypothetical protein